MRLKSTNQQNARGPSCFLPWELPRLGRERREGIPWRTRRDRRSSSDQRGNCRIEKDVSSGKLVAETASEHENGQLSCVKTIFDVTGAWWPGESEWSLAGSNCLEDNQMFVCANGIAWRWSTVLVYLSLRLLTTRETESFSWSTLRSGRAHSQTLQTRCREAVYLFPNWPLINVCPFISHYFSNVATTGTFLHLSFIGPQFQTTYSHSNEAYSSSFSVQEAHDSPKINRMDALCFDYMTTWPLRIYPLLLWLWAIIRRFFTRSTGVDPIRDLRFVFFATDQNSFSLCTLSETEKKEPVQPL